MATVDPAYLAAKRASRDPSTTLTAGELARFMSYVQMEPTTGCWLWIGPTVGYGYGSFSLRYKNVLAHRAIWSHLNGPIPADAVLDHEVCDTPQCCNPDHVRPKTQRENLLRGATTITARNAAKTHCPNGHPFEAGNLVQQKSRPGRLCLTCTRARERARSARRRAARAAVPKETP